jgi:hypothetical protein
MPDPFESLSGAIDEIVRLLQTGERLAAASASLGPTASLLESLSDSDPELLPEIHAAMEHVAGAAHALGRAVDFASARYDVRIGQLFPAVTPTDEEDAR